MKEGMKVRLTRDTSYFNEGDVGVVKLADADNTSLVEVKGEAWWVANGKLEEVKSMKIGDKVRIIDDRNCCFKNGDVGVVIDLDDSDIPIKVRRDEDTIPQWFEEKQLELIAKSKYQTRPISYDGCHPVIAEHLKRGEMILCMVWDNIIDAFRKRFVTSYLKDPLQRPKYIIEDGTRYDCAEPVVQKQVKVKKASEIVRWLEENGYIAETEEWSSPGKVNWNHEMFQYCGKEPAECWEWLAEWLEEV